MGSGDGDPQNNWAARLAKIVAENTASPPVEKGREGDAAPQEVALTSQAPTEPVKNERVTPQGGADAKNNNRRPTGSERYKLAKYDSGTSSRSLTDKWRQLKEARKHALSARRERERQQAAVEAEARAALVALQAQSHEHDPAAWELEKRRLAAQAQKFRAIINNGNALPAPAPAVDAAAMAQKAEQQAAQQAEREANAAAAQQAADEKKAADIAALTQKIANKKAEIVSLEPQAPADPVAKKQLNKARHALANLENALLELTAPEAAREKKVNRLQGKISAAEKELNALPATQATKPQRAKLHATLATLKQKLKALTPLAEQELPTAPKAKGAQALSATKPSRLEARVAEAREKVARAEAAAAQATVAAETDPAKRAQAKRLTAQAAALKSNFVDLEQKLATAQEKATKRAAEKAARTRDETPSKPLPTRDPVAKAQKKIDRLKARGNPQAHGTAQSTVPAPLKKKKAPPAQAKEPINITPQSPEDAEIAAREAAMREAQRKKEKICRLDEQIAAKVLLLKESEAGTAQQKHLQHNLERLRFQRLRITDPIAAEKQSLERRIANTRERIGALGESPNEEMAALLSKKLGVLEKKLKKLNAPSEETPLSREDPSPHAAPWAVRVSPHGGRASLGSFVSCAANPDAAAERGDPTYRQRQPFLHR